jgi:hypothetical protein
VNRWLRKQSQQHNIKLGLLAEQILKDLVELSTKSSLAGLLALAACYLPPINASRTSPPAGGWPIQN